MVYKLYGLTEDGIKIVPVSFDPCSFAPTVMLPHSFLQKLNVGTSAKLDVGVMRSIKN